MMKSGTDKPGSLERMVRPLDVGMALIAVAVMVNAANLWQLRSKVLVLEQPQVRRRVPEQNLHHPPLQSQFPPQQCHLLVHESLSTHLQ
jgi:hypothetical protein